MLPRGLVASSRTSQPSGAITSASALESFGYELDHRTPPDLDAAVGVDR